MSVIFNRLETCFRVSKYSMKMCSHSVSCGAKKRREGLEGVSRVNDGERNIVGIQIKVRESGQKNWKNDLGK